ncbi:Tigger transposable element-derived protein 1 [Portunus trituberculatus]|uniref:Tigger transposable element-derived protein 1 n=1 Tax=Portunus trituberculatus TaxID=210409 RepID=A0A5B7K3E0_PORTR|nr:Tigger transposable element-derived protein 1 [Portunus trituberculatus]
MNLACNKVWPECTHSFPGFAEDDISAIRNDIINLCHRAGLYEVDDDDVQDVLESHTKSLSNDELIDLDKASQEVENEGDKEEEPVRGLDIKTLTECLDGIKKAPETLKERDPNPATSSKVAHDVEKSVKIYQEIYDEKNKINQTVLHLLVL